MGVWIEENLPALCFGAGIGAIVTGWFNPHDFFWVLGALSGVAIALPIWQINKEKWRERK